MKRYGQLIGLKKERLEEYRRYHREVWPGVLDTIRRCNIRNYSIFYRDGVLFAYFEYHGDDFAADMAKMGEDPVTQKWWEIMMPMQQPVEGCPQGEWWDPMEEVFHTD